MKQIVKILTDMISRRIYGSLLIKLQAGKIVHIYKGESPEIEK